MPRVLVDTNVLVYAHDPADLRKQRRAIAVLDGLQTGGNGLLSAQCLAEFYQTAVRARPRALMTADEAVLQVARLARSFQVLPVTAMVVLEAIRGAARHELAYWDAQVWAVARLNQVPVVFSEDCRIDAVVEGIRFVDPFEEARDLSLWL